MKHIIKKADIILLIVLVVLGLGLSWLSAASSVTGQKAVISVGGSVYGTYDMADNQTVTVKHDGHINKITIKDGRVQMSYANCKNQICVHDGWISKTSQSIVCLPNKVVVEIKGVGGDYDAIAQ